jgi:hypothetical protein
VITKFFGAEKFLSSEPLVVTLRRGLYQLDDNCHYPPLRHSYLSEAKRKLESSTVYQNSSLSKI